MPTYFSMSSNSGNNDTNWPNPSPTEKNKAINPREAPDTKGTLFDKPLLIPEVRAIKFTGPGDSDIDKA